MTIHSTCHQGNVNHNEIPLHTYWSKQWQILMKVWSITNSFSLLVRIQHGAITWRNRWVMSLTQPNIALPYGSAIIYFGCYPDEFQNPCPGTTLHITVWSSCQMSIRQLLQFGLKYRVKKMFKKKKLWYVQIMKYYSVLKRNELCSHENT